MLIKFFFLTGHTFPTLKEADAMFLAEKAPEWKEGDCCNRCRTKFGMVNRQVGFQNSANQFSYLPTVPICG